MKFVDFLKNVFGSLVSMSKNDPAYEVVSNVEEHDEAMSREDEETIKELNRSTRKVEQMAQDMVRNVEGSKKTMSYGNGVFDRVNPAKNEGPKTKSGRKPEDRDMEL